MSRLALRTIAPDEEVEEHEEGELEGEQDLLDRGRADGHGSSRRNSSLVAPIVTVSPGSSLARFVRGAVDLDAVRRAEVDDPVRRPVLAQLRVLARRVRVGEPDVALAGAADRDAPLDHLVRLAVDDEGDDLPLRRGSRLRRGLRLGHSRLVDHRRAGLDLGRVGDQGRALRLRHPRRDPELAHGQVRVGLDQHPRLGEQRIALPARVLDQVLLQLAEERGLVPGELLAVARSRGRARTRSGRRRARPRSCGARPSPSRACVRARRAGRSP